MKMILFGIALFVSASEVRAEHTTPRTPSHAAVSESPLAGSAILDLFSGPSSSWPKTLSDMYERFEKVTQLKFLSDDVRSNYVVHSNAPSKTSAEEPRFLYASNGGELYMGAIPSRDGKIEYEFISWNRKKNAYDFGIIQDFGTPQARLELANRSACMQCHISGGPHYMPDPWPSTQEKLENRRAVLMALAQNDKRYSGLKDILSAQAATKDPFEDPKVVDFFAKHPSLIKLHGIDLNRNGVTIPGIENTANTGRNYEDAVIRGSIRAIVSDYTRNLKSDTEREKFVNALMEIHLRQSFASEALPAHKKLAQDVSSSSSHVSVLFNPKIPEGKPLKKSDFLPTAFPLALNDNDTVINSGADPLYRRTKEMFGRASANQQMLGEVFKARTGRTLPTSHDAEDIKVLEEITSDLLRTPSFLEIRRSKTVPTRGDFAVAMESAARLLVRGWRPPKHDLEEPSFPTAPPKELTEKEKTRAEIKEFGVCLSCHRSMTGSLSFEFPVEDPKAWEARLKRMTQDEVPRFKRLRNKILERLQDKDDPMPPPDTEQWNNFSAKQRDTVIEYLKALKIE